MTDLISPSNFRERLHLVLSVEKKIENRLCVQLSICSEDHRTLPRRHSRSSDWCLPSHEPGINECLWEREGHLMQVHKRSMLRCRTHYSPKKKKCDTWPRNVVCLRQTC